MRKINNKWNVKCEGKHLDERIEIRGSLALFVTVIWYNILTKWYKTSATRFSGSLECFFIKSLLELYMNWNWNKLNDWKRIDSEIAEKIAFKWKGFGKLLQFMNSINYVVDSFACMFWNEFLFELQITRNTP